MTEQQQETKVSHTLYIPGREKIEWEPDNPQSLSAAQNAFSDAKSKGMRAFDMSAATAGADPKTDGVTLGSFLPEATEIRMVAQYAGG